MGKKSIETKACDSCLNYETCEQTIKDKDKCYRYRTRVVMLFDGKQIRFHCPVNDRYSEWRTREECSENWVKIAEELNVNMREPWKLLVTPESDYIKFPTTKIIRNFPVFDLTDLTPERKRSIRFEVATWLMKNYTFLTLKDTDKIYVFENGIYVPKSEELIAKAIRDALGEDCTAYDRNETKAAIRDVTLVDREIFTNPNPEHVICLENGILNLDTLEFEDHTPTKFFLTKIPVKYDPEATCPKTDAFFRQVVDKSDVQTLYEIIGYCIWPGYEIHKAFMAVGGGANGKTVYLNLVQAFLGPNNISGLSLQQLINSRFSSAILHEKFANICSDIPSKGLAETGPFKWLTGSDRVGAEIKFGKHFTFWNRAKMLFSANQIPEVRDDTDAFFRRWIIIVFPKIFSAYTTPKADPYLLKKLTTPEELSGLLNKAIEALTKMLQRGSFHGDKPTAEWREDYIRKSDPIAAFFMDCLKEVNNRDKFITKAALYQAFITYCKKQKLPPADSTVFSRKIKKNFEIAQDSTARIEGKKVRVWRFLQFKPKNDKGEEEKEKKEKKINGYFPNKT